MAATSAIAAHASCLVEYAFQPGELAKIALAIFFAGYLVRTRESLTSVGTRFLGMTWPRARELGPLLVIWLISLGIT
ncbi:MAG TPA: hypothetical protein VM430_06920, partial [Microbacterium sp.]|nr:hypothetical protein [Microbacterium sp.]